VLLSESRAALSAAEALAAAHRAGAAQAAHARLVEGEALRPRTKFALIAAASLVSIALALAAGFYVLASGGSLGGTKADRKEDSGPGRMGALQDIWASRSSKLKGN